MGEPLAPPYKVVLLGDTSVGKTSIVHRFINGSFDAHISNTIGAAFSTKLCNSKENSDKLIKIELWDTAGQERYRSLTPMYYRNSKVALVCFDMSNFKETFERAKFWVDQVQLNVTQEGDERKSLKLIGNKSDLVDEVGNSEEIMNEVAEYCNLTNTKYYFTSAKTGKGVEELFEDIVDEVPLSFIKDYAEQIKRSEESRTQFNGINIFNHRSLKTQCC